MSVTLINPFVVSDDQESDFIESWRESAEALAKAPGFIETNLHRNTGATGTDFRFVNIAIWESVESYHAAFKHTSNAKHIEGVGMHPGLFTSLIKITKDDLA